MTRLETRGERLARKPPKPRTSRWITTESPERDGQLDMWDSGRYHHPETATTPLTKALEFEAMNVPKHETFEKAPSIWVPMVVGVSASAGGFVAFLIAWAVGAL